MMVTCRHVTTNKTASRPSADPLCDIIGRFDKNFQLRPTFIRVDASSITAQDMVGLICHCGIAGRFNKLK